MKYEEIFSRIIILGLFAFIGLIILVALIAEWSIRSRMLKASNNICPYCKKIFGLVVFKNLRKQVKEKVTENRLLHLSRLGQRTWKFKCPHCESELMVNLNSWEISIPDKNEIHFIK